MSFHICIPRLSLGNSSGTSGSWQRVWSTWRHDSPVRTFHARPDVASNNRKTRLSTADPGYCGLTVQKVGRTLDLGLGGWCTKGKSDYVSQMQSVYQSKRITNSWVPALATTVVILCNDRWPGSWMWSASSMGRKTRLYITWCARCAFFSSCCASFLTSCEDQTMLEVELSECWDVDIRAWLRKYQLVPP